MPKSKADGFLNVDLEVGARSRAQLAPVFDAFDGKLFELFRGRIGGLYRGHYEISGCTRDASATIHALADVIEAMKPAGRRAWKAAVVREFNVGVDLERGVKYIELAIDPEAIRRVAKLGAQIAFTAYQVAEMAPR